MPGKIKLERKAINPEFSNTVKTIENNTIKPPTITILIIASFMALLNVLPSLDNETISKFISIFVLFSTFEGRSKKPTSIAEM